MTYTEFFNRVRFLSRRYVYKAVTAPASAQLGFSPRQKRNSLGLPWTRAATYHLGYGAPGFIGHSRSWSMSSGTPSAPDEPIGVKETMI
jgi:hypothetical protein